MLPSKMDFVFIGGDKVMRGSRIVIPKGLRNRVLKLAHEGHQGFVKMKNRLRSKAWWPKIDNDAERVCRSRHGCQIVGGYNPPEPMQEACHHLGHGRILQLICWDHYQHEKVF